MLINKMEVPRTRGESARHRAVLLLVSALVSGSVFAAMPASANAGSADSVRITLDCEGPDREHILCINP